MPSERRLHPISVVFVVAGQAREMIVPGLTVIFAAGTTGGDWQVWLMVLFVPYAALAFARCVAYRYRFEESEMVVRSGLLFRNERHIPYARIQNIDAIQTVFHRPFGVVEVRVETGAGSEPDARMQVLPLAGLEEMRARVFAAKAQVEEGGGAQADARPAEPVRTVLELPARELLLAGFIDNRGAVVIAAAFGLLWELGFLDRAMETALGESSTGRGMASRLVRSILGAGAPPVRHILWGLAALTAILLGIRLLSMAWAIVRLHGFHLIRAGDDLRAEYGLLTRVAATIPVRRIQTLTISQGPLHRLFGRAAVRADTAGGEGIEQARVHREPLAPIIRVGEVPRLLGEVVPEVSLEGLAWQPPAPRAFRRALARGSVTAVVVSLALVMTLKWSAVAVFSALLALAAVRARVYVRHLGWVRTDHAVLFRSGWLWRHVTIARFSKMQVVAFKQSPFDRRTRMATVLVDTAGASGSPNRVSIPFMPVDTARDLQRDLALQAARSAFRW